jgi:hypothetical protein
MEDREACDTCGQPTNGWDGWDMDFFRVSLTKKKLADKIFQVPLAYVLP